ncbi:MAG: hypothetical protein ACE147_05585 [Candidatus Methylomirabilales bacterium]
MRVSVTMWSCEQWVALLVVGLIVGVPLAYGALGVRASRLAEMEATIHRLRRENAQLRGDRG